MMTMIKQRKIFAIAVIAILLGSLGLMLMRDDPAAEDNIIATIELPDQYVIFIDEPETEEEHVEAVAEMSRVATEVRIFPLVNMFDGGPSQHVEAVVTRIHQAGGSATKKNVQYEFQRGGNEMLVVV